jgi:integrase
LHIEDLDFDKSIVHSIVHIRRGTFRLIGTDTKTAAGQRDVDIHREAMKVVKQFIGDRKTGRIFMTRNGTPLVHGNINRYVLKPICKKLGIPPATTHAWRHGRISILQQKRVPADFIKQWVGHTSLQTTGNYYALRSVM